MPRSAAPRVGQFVPPWPACPDGREDVELNSSTHGGSLLVGVKGLEEPTGLGMPAAAGGVPADSPWGFLTTSGAMGWLIEILLRT